MLFESSSARRGCAHCGVVLRPWHETFCNEACYQAGMIANVTARFWSKVAKSPDPDGCWLWTGKAMWNGYGMMGVGRQVLYAHRVSYELNHGPIPDGLLVLHSCDVRLCVRPDHLSVGTQGQNIRDAVARGRFRSISVTAAHLSGDHCPVESHARGEGVGTARLTADDVREIRRLYAAGDINQDELARRFGIHTSNVSMIVNRKSWKHIT
jgi:hypothetical protein